MKKKKFKSGVAQQLKHYVYLLVDPRTKLPFYVGRGLKNRVFDHMNDIKNSTRSQSGEDSKTKKIRKIINAGREVEHVIHRYGLCEEEAKKVEAALIDVFLHFDEMPKIENKQRELTEYGPATEEDLNARYGKKMKIYREHKIIVFKVPKTYSRKFIGVSKDKEWRKIYNAVCIAWRVNIKRAKKADYVFAVQDGVCLEVFKIDKKKKEGIWLRATKENFRHVKQTEPVEWKKIEDKWGFKGSLAEDFVRNRYRFKSFPEILPDGKCWNKKGAQNPFRYIQC